MMSAAAYIAFSLSFPVDGTPAQAAVIGKVGLGRVCGLGIRV